MFFIVSKLIALFLTPVSWILILVFISFLVKRTTLKKKLSIIAILLTVVFSNPFLYNKTVLWWQEKPVKFNENQRFTTGILLGGLSKFDKNGLGYFTISSDRFIATVQLYHQGYIKKIIISGGSAAILIKEPIEADFLKAQLIKSGIPENDIITDLNSRSTFENAICSKKIIDSLHLNGPFVLITSAYHMPRALKVFKKADIDVIAYPCDFIEIDNTFSIENFFFPKPALLTDWRIMFKEIIGTIIYEITGKA
jgi:uncharacterized SAM-binding protein YcdF (DUF218 family)